MTAATDGKMRGETVLTKIDKEHVLVADILKAC